MTIRSELRAGEADRFEVKAVENGSVGAIDPDFDVDEAGLGLAVDLFRRMTPPGRAGRLRASP